MTIGGALLVLSGLSLSDVATTAAVAVAITVWALLLFGVRGTWRWWSVPAALACGLATVGWSLVTGPNPLILGVVIVVQALVGGRMTSSEGWNSLPRSSEADR
ncbi:MAG: hypothetical protein JHC95_06760 [Solirubrobacteraceae bacterium]|nr:hypothetical protein [Solirubrobacteraceae bacterium]